MADIKTDFFDTSKFVISLKPKHFDPSNPAHLIKHKCSIVMFYCHWCPHCQKMVDTWKELGEIAAFFDVCAFDCVGNAGHLEKIKEVMPALVKGYPTIIIYERGVPIQTFSDDRTIDNLIMACMNACKDVNKEDVLKQKGLKRT